MSVYKDTSITPLKLMQQPKIINTQISAHIPIKQLLMLQSKPFKPAPPFRVSSVTPCPNPKPKTKELPSFLAEYLDCSEEKSSYTKINQKIRTKPKLPASTQHNIKYTKSSYSTPIPTGEAVSSRKALRRALYEPSAAKNIAGSKLEKFLKNRVGIAERKNMIEKNRIRLSENKSNNQENLEVRVSVDKYSVDYYGIFKKIMDINEQAKNEVEQMEV